MEEFVKSIEKEFGAKLVSHEELPSGSSLYFIAGRYRNNDGFLGVLKEKYGVDRDVPVFIEYKSGGLKMIFHGRNWISENLKRELGGARIGDPAYWYLYPDGDKWGLYPEKTGTTCAEIAGKAKEWI